MAKNVLYFRPSNDELAKAKAIKTYLQGRGRGALNRWLTEAMFEKWEREATTVRKKGARQPSKLVDDGNKQVHMDVPKEFVKNVGIVMKEQRVSKNDAIMYMSNAYEWVVLHEKIVGQNIKKVAKDAATMSMDGMDKELDELQRRYGLSEQQLDTLLKEGEKYLREPEQKKLGMYQ